MVTFKSQATGDLIMLDRHAEALLKLLGKSAAQAGILEVADMPHALSALRALEEPRDDQAVVGAGPQDTAQPDEAPGFQDEPVSLRQRAVPFIRLIEQAQAGGKPIVWGA